VSASTSASSLPKGELAVVAVWGGWKVLDWLNGSFVVDSLRAAFWWLAVAGAVLAFVGLVLLSWPS
jgi:hypothetical protein